MSMTARDAAQEYIKGRDAHREAMKISDAQIAKKFEYSAGTIGNVCRGIKTRVPAEDQRLIRELKAEQQRLREFHRERLLPTLAHRAGLRQSDIKVELHKLGVTVL